ncbi:DUF983 domain-containing protein [Notoacmeibacter ruber]|uniref:DUF983 domain-containing protein n=1 Tax=Notoacmeibacter ruber TaxID=2670375 RepID=A0A3L7J9N3_9HYPH|nr:DUF983 domain-containing protein [Notoacmeibacter ruber]RLQ87457.1 DUF983 domain-containing protein [Notoacmeibacter ruber]
MTQANETPETSTVIQRGALGRCPRCGEGALIEGFLTVPASCTSCGLDYSFEDSGDGPVPFVILIIGALVIGGALALEVSYAPSFLVHLLVWVPIGFLAGAALLRTLKGVLIALQWQNNSGERRYRNGSS